MATNCPEEMVAAQAGPGQGVIVTDEGDGGAKWYAPGGVLTRRPKLAFDKWVIAADGQDAARLEVGEPFEITIDGARFMAEEGSGRDQLRHARPLPRRGRAFSLAAAQGGDRRRMKLTVRKDIAALRRDAVNRINELCGQVRARFVTVIPAQDMIYLEKASEGRRFLAEYPDPESQPAEVDPDPSMGFPFISREVGITAADRLRGRDVLRAGRGAVSLRGRGDRGDPARLGAGGRGRREPRADRRHRRLLLRPAGRAADPVVLEMLAGSARTVLAMKGSVSPEANLRFDVSPEANLRFDKLGLQRKELRK